MKTHMGEFGTSHIDKLDDAGGLTAMISNSTHPQGQGYENGRFHLLALGFWVDLRPLHIVNFSGLRQHGGTPPLAPPGKEPRPSDYRFITVLYPPRSLMSGAGSHTIGLAALPRHELFKLAPEMTTLV